NQGAASGSGVASRRWQHLCRRELVAGEASSGATRGQVAQKTSRNVVERAAGNLAESHCDARFIHFRFSRRRGRAGRISAAPSGVWTRRKRLSPVQDCDPARNGGGTRRLFLAAVPVREVWSCGAAISAER